MVLSGKEKHVKKYVKKWREFGATIPWSACLVPGMSSSPPLLWPQNFGGWKTSRTSESVVYPIIDRFSPRCCRISQPSTATKQELRDDFLERPKLPSVELQDHTSAVARVMQLASGATILVDKAHMIG